MDEGVAEARAPMTKRARLEGPTGSCALRHAPTTAIGTESPSTAIRPEPPPSTLFALPQVLLHRILASVGRGSRGAYASCRTLREAFRAALGSPETAARYCLAAWGKSSAAVGAVRYGRRMFLAANGVQAVAAAAPPPQGQPHQGPGSGEHLRRVLKVLGGDLRAKPTDIIRAAVAGGDADVLEEVLGLLAELPDGQAGAGPSAAAAQPRSRPYTGHISACCSEIVRAQRADMAQLLVRAVTQTAGVPLHQSTHNTAIRNAACSGRADVMDVLLATHPPYAALQGALWLASKTEHVAAVQRLLNSGAHANASHLLSATWGSGSEMVRMLALAARADGNLHPGDLHAALERVCSTRQPVRDSGRSLRFLVSELGADPRVDDSVCLAVACANKNASSALPTSLVTLGADADAALKKLCSRDALPPWMVACWPAGARGVMEAAAEGAGVLLALGAETGAGAAAAMRTALVEQQELQAQALLLWGAVPAEECAALVREVVSGGGGGIENGGAAGGAAAQAGAMVVAAGGAAVAAAAAGGAAAVAGAQAAHGDGQLQQPMHPQQEEEEGGEEGGELLLQAGQPEAAQALQRRRSWDWLRQLAGMGALPRGEVERQMEEAARRGDEEGVRELAGLGVAGREAVVAALWLALDGGGDHGERVTGGAGGLHRGSYSGCVAALMELAVVPEEVRAEAARVEAAQRTLRRLGADR